MALIDSSTVCPLLSESLIVILVLLGEVNHTAFLVDYATAGADKPHGDALNRCAFPLVRVLPAGLPFVSEAYCVHAGTWSMRVLQSPRTCTARRRWFGSPPSWASP